MGDSRYYGSHQGESSRGDRSQKNNDHKSPLTRIQMELWEERVKDPNRHFNETMHSTYNGIRAYKIDHKEEKLKLLQQIQHMVDMETAIATNPDGANLINFYKNNMSFNLINNLTKDQVLERTEEAKSYVDAFEYY